MSIRVVARVIALPEKVEELKSILINLVEPTRKETGCLQYDLLHNQSDSTDFTFVEEWTTKKALEEHLRSNHIQLAIQQIDGLVVHEPDIRIYNQISPR